MINSQFNSDVNFTKGQIDIKELNAFMNEKKRKVEKELTKYDVDKDTQFKAQNLQHLTSMAQYMPLFTKKIKDPKAIKKQKATREMDYTHKNSMIPPPNKAPQVLSPLAEPITAQTERIIRDPGPRIVNKDQYQEIQQMKVTKQINENKAAATVSNKNEEKAVGKKKDKSPSPQRKLPNEDLLIPPIDRETLAFNHQIEEKRLELEALTFKHAKAQAKFLQIMRELSKFRDEFNEQYSIRSKMLKVKEVTTQIDELLKVKEQMLASDEAILSKFTQSEQLLLDPKSPQLTSRRTPLNDKTSATMERCQLKAMNEIGAKLSSMCIFNKKNQPDTQDTRIISISNIPCIVTCNVNKQKAVCAVTIRTKISHELFTYQFKQLTEKFDPWQQLIHLRLVVQEGILKLEYVKDLDDKYISTSGGIYAFQDKKIIVYIYGAPQRFVSLNLLPVVGPTKKLMKISLLDPDYVTKYCTVEVTEERLFRDILPSGFHNSKGYETEIKTLIYKQDAVRGMITKYIMQQLQTVKVGQDISEATLISSSKISGEKLILEPPTTADAVIPKYHSLGIIDREAHSIKVRQADFPGLKISQQILQQLNPTQGNTLNNASNKNSMRFASLQRKESSALNGSNSLLKSSLGLSNEVMHQAVFDALNKKREFAQSEARGAAMGGRSNTVSPSETPIKTHNKQTSGLQKSQQEGLGTTNAQKNTKMQQIMKLIQANSMYMQIHGELYIHDKDDFAAFLELVHNTDDDSLLLFLVDDPQDCYVKEVKLNTDLSDNEEWLLIQQRFGKNVEQLLCNVETIFRSTEFFNIVKHLVQLSRLERNYYNKIQQKQFSLEDGEVSVSPIKESNNQISAEQNSRGTPGAKASSKSIRLNNAIVKQNVLN